MKLLKRRVFLVQIQHSLWCIVVSALGFLLAGCASFKIRLDKKGLKEITGALRQATHQSEARTFESFLDSFTISLTPVASPDTVVMEPFHRWKLRSSKSGGTVIGERLWFASPLPRTDGWDKRGYFYYFHRIDQTSHRAILFAPGFGVSDFAFMFIRNFFEKELSLGWSVLVWVPPYHLERLSPKEKPGTGLITEDPRDLLTAVSTSLGELSLGIQWLREQGITNIGAWGGSFGASVLLIYARTYPFDHISVMIPLIDWRTLWEAAELAPVRVSLLASGYTEASLTRAFSLISPRSSGSPETKLKTPGNRIQFLVATYDQINTEPIVSSYAASLGAEIERFQESHSSILLNKGVYRAYGAFLSRMSE
ncbi:MAG: hypothetical protein SNJ56_01520 [Termitinemataceae bacterium]